MASDPDFLMERYRTHRKTPRHHREIEPMEMAYYDDHLAEKLGREALEAVVMIDDAIEDNEETMNPPEEPDDES